MADLQYPNELRYSKTHEWARVNGTEVTIGISDYAQDELGDVVSIELPWDDAGQREYAAAQHFGDIDSVKATSELFVPVAGALVRVNEALRDAPEMVNTDPYGEGWMLVLQVADASALDAMMTRDQYLEFLKTQGH